MRARSTIPTQNQIVRAIKAAMASGLTVAEFVTTRDGVRIITTDGMKNGAPGGAKNPWDEVLPDGAAE